MGMGIEIPSPRQPCQYDTVKCCGFPDAWETARSYFLMQLQSRASAPLTARENWSSIVDMAIDAQEDYEAKKEKRQKLIYSSVSVLDAL